MGAVLLFGSMERGAKGALGLMVIEHIGIALVGFGVGGAGIFAGAWHLLNHALAKSTAFYGAGLVFLGHDHRMLDRVTGLLVHMPLAGTAILVAGVALAGMPPFGLFISELLIAASAYAVRPEVAGVFLLLLTLAFATLLYQVFRMILGAPAEPGRPLGRQCRLCAGTAIGVNVVGLGTIGLYVPRDMTVVLDTMIKLFSRTTEFP
ncbi:MAG: hypothetical protein NNA20_11470 [Nitrospira sp.]|nr:hypothetical protein [Nitrospira sp.]MCP9443201.1 hypothetical protein [Nitrospira sp.]